MSISIVRAGRLGVVTAVGAAFLLAGSLVQGEVIFLDNDIVISQTDGVQDFPGTAIEEGGNPPSNDDSREEDGNQFGAFIGPFLDQDPNRGIAATFHAEAAAVPNGLLEVGNALRFSLWMGSDPNDPFVAPNVNVIKFELYTTPLALNGEVGARTLDTDQDRNGAELLPSGQAGATSFTEADLTDSDWTQFSYEYVVDQADLDANGPTDVAAVEEIRAAMFVGNWGAGEGPGGTLLFDRAMIEWFDTAEDMNATPLDATHPGAFPTGNVSEPIGSKLEDGACRRRPMQASCSVSGTPTVAIRVPT